MQIYHDKSFVNPIDKIVAFNNVEFIDALYKLEEYRKQNYYSLGYIRYCAKDIFLGKSLNQKHPLLYFEVFKTFSHYEPKEKCNHINIYSEPQITFEQYSKALNKIKQHIAKGNTYEVNYTYPYKVYTDKTGLELYNNILPKQKTPYNTYIKNNYEEILSFSPELFFRLEGNKITTKPMKGTIARGNNKQEDINNKEFLYNDTKNKSENVMIVDLLRNDLSKIAQTGSVNVDKLFEIETHPTVFQMTSEISAVLKDNIKLYDILNAIFPCGSITGAPKISTMNIIQDLEYYPRDIYCGAIGYITKDSAEFSVPIRILQKKKEENFYKYHTGGAIVWDSEIKDEWEETLTKKKILKTPIEYQLVETLLIKNSKAEFFEEHKNRITFSAQKLGYKFNSLDFKFDLSKDCIARFLLHKGGSHHIEYKSITPILSNKIKIAKHKTNSKNPLLYYKTNFRPWYDIDIDGYFDIIFFNQNEELTEGTRSNIVLKLNNELYTPPVESGILNGIYRQHLINNKIIKEKVLYKEDLFNAEEIYCINSVRGLKEVKLCS